MIKLVVPAFTAMALYVVAEVAVGRDVDWNCLLNIGSSLTQICGMAGMLVRLLFCMLCSSPSIAHVLSRKQHYSLV